jgi:hypothetical protein
METTNIKSSIAFTQFTSKDGKRVIFSCSLNDNNHSITLMESFNYLTFHLLPSEFKECFILGVEERLKKEVFKSIGL